MFSPGLLISKRFFQGGLMSALHIKCLSQSTSSSFEADHPPAEHRRTYSKQDDGSTTSAEKLKTLVIQSQETHCTTTERLVIANFELAGSLSRKHRLAKFVYERLNWTSCSQSPPSSDTEWLSVDVDRYKIVNIYKPPPT